MNVPTVHTSRRSFLKTTSVLAGATGLPAWFVERELAEANQAAPARSPHERPGIALVGCGGRGRGVAGEARRFGDIVAVCDVDARRAEEAAHQFARGGQPVRTFRDFREVMRRPDVHVVINGTPDHWHTLINLAAALARKDVYSEKPLTLTIDEGRRLVRTVARQRIVFQTGSQQRSDARFRLACELVRNNRLGRLRHVDVWLPAGLRDGPFHNRPVPQGLDWDRWLGQAPRVDYVPQRCHLTFRYWLDYSGGTLTDWGAHHNDIARWAMGLAGPVGVEGRLLAQPLAGGYTAPSAYEVRYTYANGVTQTVRSTPDDNIFGGSVRREGQHNGIRFEGPDGWIWVNRGELHASDPELLRRPLPGGAERLPVSDNHMANFFECVRSRRQPICDAEVGHRSASLCHLGGIALRLGHPLRWDPQREQFVGEHAAAANALVAREMRRPYDYRFVE
jgi:predicted dehydrogenase